MTQRETILRVAATLPQPFSCSQLIVAAWMADPQAFGLPGIPEYPDARRLHNALHGHRGMLRGGELIRDGTGLRLPRDDEKHRGWDARLIHAARSRAYRDYDSGLKTASFDDALEFWGVVEPAANGALPAAIAVLDWLLMDRDTPELRALGACHDYLRGVFARQIGRSG